MNGIGWQFQQETKYVRGALPGGKVNWRHQPSRRRQRPERRFIELPRPQTPPKATLAEVLGRRRSMREFSEAPLTLAELSFLLWASGGIADEDDHYEFRTAPSAGALYPVETYLAVHRVNGLAAGIYHYGVKGHVLEALRAGDVRAATAAAALDQQTAAQAAAVWLWTAVFARCAWKYGQRAYRYVYLDAGHIAQNLALAATSLGLGSCQIGALYDDEANTLVAVDGTEESVLYMSAVGRPR